jgi:hypothetical protein
MSDIRYEEPIPPIRGSIPNPNPNERDLLEQEYFKRMIIKNPILKSIKCNLSPEEMQKIAERYLP